MRPKYRSLFRDFSDLGQTEDLETAAVSQNRPVPGHESMQPAQLGHHFVTWSQREVISVAQDHLCPGRADLTDLQALDRALRPHRHERRGLYHSMRRMEPSSPGTSAGL